MKYTLDKLNHLICKTLDPRQGSPPELTDAWIQQQAELARAEKERIQLLLLRRPSKRSKIKAMMQVAGYYQSSLIRLLDKLYGYQKMTKDRQSSIFHLYQSVQGHLEALLTLIEERFSEFFDVSHQVPDAYLALCRRLLRLKAVELHRRMTPFLKDTGLLDITLSCLKGSPTDQDVKLNSFRDLMYRKGLVSELLHTNWAKKGNAERRLQEILVSLNYNHSGFIRHRIERLQVSLRKCRTLPAKKQWLIRVQKELRQLPLLPRMGLKEGFPSVAAELDDWIRAELACLAHFEVEYTEILPAPKKNSYPEAGVDVYVELPLTEAGILVLLKSAIDGGLVLNQTYKGLMYKIGGGIATKYKKGVSADSVLKKGNRITPNTKDHLTELLRNMIRIINKY